ncbi:MAG: TetR/AcrR family transcriptional regulator [Caulobacteraceae bacterium]|nr:TetR/AcrR family transcriptional regulator [Caulobacter sp.]
MARNSSAVLDRDPELSPESPDPSCCNAKAKARPRERIVATAREMFHAQGFRPVGVEAIAEAAGTNKMTLYRHFGSKDELIVECLRSVFEEGEALWRALEERHRGDPRGQLTAWIREKADYVLTDCRGCTMANAAVEIAEADHPARRFIEERKAAYRVRLTALCAAAGAAQAELLADALFLLLEGARVTRQMGGIADPHAKFLQTAEAMIGAFTESRPM